MFCFCDLFIENKCQNYATLSKKQYSILTGSYLGKRREGGFVELDNHVLFDKNVEMMRGGYMPGL